MTTYEQLAGAGVSTRQATNLTGCRGRARHARKLHPRQSSLLRALSP